MNTNYLICSLLCVFFAATSYAQNTNAEKILGCWVLKKMVYNNIKEESPEISEEAINSYVCFEKNGLFFTRLGGQESKVVKGKYQISDDGNRLSQSRDMDEEGTDEQAEIALLNETKLQLKLEFGTMFFERKN